MVRAGTPAHSPPPTGIAAGGTRKELLLVSLPFSEGPVFAALAHEMPGSVWSLTELLRITPAPTCPGPETPHRMDSKAWELPCHQLRALTHTRELLLICTRGKTG